MRDLQNRNKTLQERCSRLDFLVLDVDGVLTEGRIVYGSDQQEWKGFHVRDGSGLKFWHQAGKRSAILTGRNSPMVARRAQELGIHYLVQGVDDKGLALREVLARAGASPLMTVCLGDDLPDLAVMAECELAVAVADACAEVRMAAHHVTRAPGGQGAVREALELILRCQGKWQSQTEAAIPISSRE